jgi:hypothetical protein
MSTDDWLFVGIVFSIFGGGIVCRLFDKAIRASIKVPKPAFRESSGVPAWLTGMIERIFFASLVWLNAAGYATGMVGWLAAKMAISWTWPELEREELLAGKSEAEIFTLYNNMRASRLISLLMGAISMGFSLAAGVMLGKLWPIH